MDISQERVKDKKLMKANRIISRSSAVMAEWVNSNKNTVRFISDNVLEMTGYPAEKFYSGKMSLKAIMSEAGFRNFKFEIRENTDKTNRVKIVHKVFKIHTADSIEKHIQADTYINKINKNRIRYETIFRDVSSKIERELTLKSTNRLMLQAFEAARIAWWEWDIQNNLIHFNTQMMQMLGIEVSDVPVSFEDWTEAVHPQDHNHYVESLYSHVYGIYNNFKFEYRRKAKNGKWKWFFDTAEVSLRSVNGKAEKLIGIIMDINDRKKDEIKSKEIAEDYEFLIHTVNTPVWGINLKGNICRWNRSMEKLTGFRFHNIIFQNFMKTFVHEESKEFVKGMIAKALKGQSAIRGEMKIKTRNNFAKFLVSASTHKNYDKRQELIFIGSDITEMLNYQGKLKNEINRRTRELENALSKEKELNKLKSKFVSMASHEFRTPLTAINFAAGFIKKYKERIDMPTFLKRIDKIQEQVKRMTELLDDVLTVGKTEDSQKAIKKQVNFKKFIIPLIEEVYHGTNAEHYIDYTLPHPETCINLDPKLAYNIYTNLLSNAVKFSPGKESVIFVNKIENNMLVSKIVDFGIGINPEEIKDIFSPFYRGDNTHNINGTGLGLSIVKNAVEAHGGTINVKSTPGRKTCFTVKIPIS